MAARRISRTGIDQGIPYASELLNPSLASVYLKLLGKRSRWRDPEQAIIRLHPEYTLEELGTEYEFHPKHHGGSSCIYWLPLCSMMAVPALGVADSMIPVTMALMTGTDFLSEATMSVRRECPYGEFPGMFQWLLAGVHAADGRRSPALDMLGANLLTGREFPPGLMRIYLCPRGLSKCYLEMLQALCGVSSNCLNNVLHGLIWYNWYAGLAIHRLVPDDG
jgi:hypothetical protein